MQSLNIKKESFYYKTNKQLTNERVKTNPSSFQMTNVKNGGKIDHDVHLCRLCKRSAS